MKPSKSAKKINGERPLWPISFYQSENISSMLQVKNKRCNEVKFKKNIVSSIFHINCFEYDICVSLMATLMANGIV